MLSISLAAGPAGSNVVCGLSSAAAPHAASRAGMVSAARANRMSLNVTRRCMLLLSFLVIALPREDGGWHPPAPLRRSLAPGCERFHNLGPPGAPLSLHPASAPPARGAVPSAMSPL